MQVIPWVLSDSNFIKYTSQKLDPQKTVFVGALHGMLTAEGLAKIMNDLFGGVVYAGKINKCNEYIFSNNMLTQPFFQVLILTSINILLDQGE